MSFLFQPTEPSHLSSPILSDDPILGMEGATADVFYTPAAQRIARHIELIVALASGVFLLTAWLLSLLHGPVPLKHLFTLLAFAIAGIPAIRSVWGKISKFRIDVDLLMLLGAVLAALIGSPFEGALLLFLFALSGGLEAMALRQTQSAIIGLKALAPTEAILMEEKGTRRVAIRQVPMGGTILVRPGDKIPLDGVVINGASSIDESAITGESVPRDCGVGDEIFSGTQNLDGRLEVNVTRLAGDTTLAKIVKLVTEAKQNPAKAQRLIDRIGPTYSVIVILATVATALISWGVGVPVRDALYRAIALLVVASPCALIIATPVAYLSAIAGAASRGILIKGGSHLETVARASAIAFDKTGTLTTGEIRLVDVVVGNGLDDSTAVTMAGAIEASSSHPLAAAVTEVVKERNLTLPPVTNYHATPGQGASGVVNGLAVWVGRPEVAIQRASDATSRWLQEHASRLRKVGKTVSVLLVGEEVALFAFQDTLRPGAKECIDQLRRQGVSWIEMLTGDHELVASRVSSALGLDGFQAALAPQDKVIGVQALQSKHGTVCLVGDGINDAPALADADTGVAMGAMGADIALDAADIVLMKDRIEAVAWLHAHARRTAKLVRQNLTLAIGVIAFLSVFAVLGRVPLPIAVIAHEGSTVVVALNALRLLSAKG